MKSPCQLQQTTTLWCGDGLFPQPFKEAIKSSCLCLTTHHISVVNTPWKLSLYKERRLVSKVQKQLVVDFRFQWQIDAIGCRRVVHWRINLLLLARTLQHKGHLFVLVSDNYSWITSICGYFILCTLHFSHIHFLYSTEQNHCMVISHIRTKSTITICTHWSKMRYWICIYV